VEEEVVVEEEDFDDDESTGSADRHGPGGEELRAPGGRSSGGRLDEDDLSQEEKEFHRGGEGAEALEAVRAAEARGVVDPNHFPYDISGPRKRLRKKTKVPHHYNLDREPVTQTRAAPRKRDKAHNLFMAYKNFEGSEPAKKRYGKRDYAKELKKRKGAWEDELKAKAGKKTQDQDPAPDAD
jgi:hypothetical protein